MIHHTKNDQTTDTIVKNNPFLLQYLSENGIKISQVEAIDIKDGQVSITFKSGEDNKIVHISEDLSALKDQYATDEFSNITISEEFSLLEIESLKDEGIYNFESSIPMDGHNLNQIEPESGKLDDGGYGYNSQADAFNTSLQSLDTRGAIEATERDLGEDTLDVKNDITSFLIDEPVKMDEALVKAPAFAVQDTPTAIEETEDVQSVQEDEDARLAQEAEDARLAQEAEDARLAQEAEDARLAQEAEDARLAQEAEDARLAQEAEDARLAQEAEDARLAQEAEDARLAQEAEDARLAQEAEDARLAQEAEDARLAQEAEDARLAQEAEDARLAQEAEDARLAQEAEDARLAQEAEDARLAQEAEDARLAQEAEDARLAQEAEEEAAQEAEDDQSDVQPVDDATLLADGEQIFNFNNNYYQAVKNINIVSGTGMAGNVFGKDLNVVQQPFEEYVLLEGNDAQFYVEIESVEYNGTVYKLSESNESVSRTNRFYESYNVKFVSIEAENGTVRLFENGAYDYYLPQGQNAGFNHPDIADNFSFSVRDVNGNLHMSEIEFRHPDYVAEVTETNLHEDYTFLGNHAFAIDPHANPYEGSSLQINGVKIVEYPLTTNITLETEFTYNGDTVFANVTQWSLTNYDIELSLADNSVMGRVSIKNGTAKLFINRPFDQLDDAQSIDLNYFDRTPVYFDQESDNSVDVIGEFSEFTEDNEVYMNGYLIKNGVTELTQNGQAIHANVVARVMTQTIDNNPFSYVGVELTTAQGRFVGRFMIVQNSTGGLKVQNMDLRAEIDQFEFDQMIEVGFADLSVPEMDVPTATGSEDTVVVETQNNKTDDDDEPHIFDNGGMVPDETVTPADDAPQKNDDPQIFDHGGMVPDETVKPTDDAPQKNDDPQIFDHGGRVPDETVKPTDDAPQKNDDPQIFDHGGMVPDETVKPTDDAPQKNDDPQIFDHGGMVPDETVKPTDDAPQKNDDPQIFDHGGMVPDETVTPVTTTNKQPQNNVVELTPQPPNTFQHLDFIGGNRLFQNFDTVEVFGEQFKFHQSNGTTGLTSNGIAVEYQIFHDEEFRIDLYKHAGSGVQTVAKIIIQPSGDLTFDVLRPIDGFSTNTRPLVKFTLPNGNVLHAEEGYGTEEPTQNALINNGYLQGTDQHDVISLVNAEDLDAIQTMMNSGQYDQGMIIGTVMTAIQDLALAEHYDVANNLIDIIPQSFSSYTPNQLYLLSANLVRMLQAANDEDSLDTVVHYFTTFQANIQDGVSIGVLQKLANTAYLEQFENVLEALPDSYFAITNETEFTEMIMDIVASQHSDSAKQEALNTISQRFAAGGNASKIEYISIVMSQNSVEDAPVNTQNTDTDSLPTIQRSDEPSDYPLTMNGELHLSSASTEATYALGNMILFGANNSGRYLADNHNINISFIQKDGWVEGIDANNNVIFSFTLNNDGTFTFTQNMALQSWDNGANADPIQLQFPIATTVNGDTRTTFFNFDLTEDNTNVFETPLWDIMIDGALVTETAPVVSPPSTGSESDTSGETTNNTNTAQDSTQSQNNTQSGQTETSANNSQTTQTNTNVTPPTTNTPSSTPVTGNSGTSNAMIENYVTDELVVVRDLDEILDASNRNNIVYGNVFEGRGGDASNFIVINVTEPETGAILPSNQRIDTPQGVVRIASNGDYFFDLNRGIDPFDVNLQEVTFTYRDITTNVEKTGVAVFNNIDNVELRDDTVLRLDNNEVVEGNVFRNDVNGTRADVDTVTFDGVTQKFAGDDHNIQFQTPAGRLVIERDGSYTFTAGDIRESVTQLEYTYLDPEDGYSSQSATLTFALGGNEAAAEPSLNLQSGVGQNISGNLFEILGFDEGDYTVTSDVFFGVNLTPALNANGETVYFYYNATGYNVRVYPNGDYQLNDNSRDLQAENISFQATHSNGTSEGFSIKINYLDDLEQVDVSVTNDVPDNRSVELSVKETDDAGLYEGVVTFSEDIPVNGDIQFALTNTFAVTGEDNNQLTSNGKNVNVSLDVTGQHGVPGNSVVGVRSDGELVFKLSLGQNGRYTFEKGDAPLDHANEQIDLKFRIEVPREDASSLRSTIVVELQDSKPIANEYFRPVFELNREDVDSGSFIDGRVRQVEDQDQRTSTVVESDSNLDILKVKEVKVGNTTIRMNENGSGVGQTEFGLLRVTADGDYSFTFNTNFAAEGWQYAGTANIDGRPQFVYQFMKTVGLEATVVDSDGDEVKIADSVNISKTHTSQFPVPQIPTSVEDGPGFGTDLDPSTTFGGGGTFNTGGNGTVTGGTSTGGSTTNTGNTQTSTGGSTTTNSGGTFGGGTGTGTTTNNGNGVNVSNLNVTNQRGDIADTNPEQVFVNTGKIVGGFTNSTLSGGSSFSSAQSGSAFDPEIEIYSFNNTNNVLTSNGEIIRVRDALSNNGTSKLFTGTVTGKTIFTFEINVNGDYTFKAFDTIDHNGNNSLPIGINIINDRTPYGGNKVEKATIRLQWEDSDVFAENDFDTARTGFRAVEGNVLTNDDLGEDDADNNVISVQFLDPTTSRTREFGIPLEDSVEVDGQYGTLTIHSDGTYSYVATSGEGLDRFRYEITDADGSKDTALLEFDVSAAASGGQSPTVRVFESDVAATPGTPESVINVSEIDGMSIINFEIGNSFSATLPNGEAVDLRSGGEQVVVTAYSRGYQGKTASGETVFDVYRIGNNIFINLHKELDHPGDINEIQLDMSFLGVTAGGEKIPYNYNVSWFDQYEPPPIDTSGTGESGGTGTSIGGGGTTDEDDETNTGTGNGNGNGNGNGTGTEDFDLNSLRDVRLVFRPSDDENDYITDKNFADISGPGTFSRTYTEKTSISGQIIAQRVTDNSIVEDYWNILEDNGVEFEVGVHFPGIVGGGNEEVDVTFSNGNVTLTVNESAVHATQFANGYFDFKPVNQEHSFLFINNQSRGITWIDGTPDIENENVSASSGGFISGNLLANDEAETDDISIFSFTISDAISERGLSTSFGIPLQTSYGSVTVHRNGDYEIMFNQDPQNTSSLIDFSTIRYAVGDQDTQGIGKWGQLDINFPDVEASTPPTNFGNNNGGWNTLVYDPSNTEGSESDYNSQWNDSTLKTNAPEGSLEYTSDSNALNIDDILQTSTSVADTQYSDEIEGYITQLAQDMGSREEAITYMTERGWIQDLQDQVANQTHHDGMW